MNVHFHTLGCKVNQYETEAIREGLLRAGYTAKPQQRADIIIINSCTVTAESDRKTRQLVRRCRRENPDSIIALTGCMVQAFPDEAENLLEADIIIGNRDINKTIDAIKGYQNKRYFEFSEHETGDAYCTRAIERFDGRTRAYMKIEDGCNRFCSYCIIPKARGRVRSRDVEDIKAEAERLSENGFKEIVLVGINLSAFGMGSDINICDAVDAVASVDKIKRIRLGSLEPDHITDQMLMRFKKQEKFCPQFHLSLQSGCDRTLKRMNRHYDSAFYFDLISRIRATFPDAAITTDIMVGFAGEAEDEFRESLDFVKKAQFARAHIFAYSRREGTVAAALPSQVSRGEKERRARLMAQISKSSEREFLNALKGNTYPVLFEVCENGFYEGYTANYSKVLVKTEENLSGKIFDVLITDVFDEYCIGKIL